MPVIRAASPPENPYNFIDPPSSPQAYNELDVHADPDVDPDVDFNINDPIDDLLPETHWQPFIELHPSLNGIVTHFLKSLSIIN